MTTPSFRARVALLACTAVVAVAPSTAHAQQPAARQPVFTHADTLRGSNGPGRAWWDVEFYDLATQVNPADSSLRGRNAVTYRVLQPTKAGKTTWQIDLQTPLLIDSVVQAGKRLTVVQDGNAWFATIGAAQKLGERHTATIYYHGKPRPAVRPPWDGGLIWRTDSLGATWTATANQGLGASVWWPNKDTQLDEPDSQRVAIRLPDPMVNVSNGRLRKVEHHDDRTTTWEWFVTRPINNYAIVINAGNYEHFSEIYRGENGPLTLDYWPLAYHRAAAEQQFKQTAPMMQCFEHWFGPYPWYEDGFKMVESPHLGMEHQSAVAYGNRYQNGYLGTDLSNTGLGLLWDFIIVHESAHEWWGNNITTQDVADMWVHESFANYAEGLYTECRMGKAAGARYTVGSRARVRNDKPIIAPYGVNEQGSGDMYYKGGNMLHTMRTVLDDDAKWRDVLRGLQKTFRAKSVTGADVQQYMSAQAGVDFSTIFTQYLTTNVIPTLEWRVDGDGIAVRWADAVPGFRLPVTLTAGGKAVKVTPSAEWMKVALAVPANGAVTADQNLYIQVKRAN